VDVAEIRAAARANPLRRSLGGMSLLALGVGAVVGAGAFSVLGLAAQAAGPAVVVSITLVAVVSALVALCYAELATLLPVGGSSYAYVLAAMGPLVAWLVAWSIALSYVIGDGAVASSFSANLQALALAAGIHWPRALGASPAAGGVLDAPAAVVVLLLTLLLLRPVRESAALNAALVVGKVLILGLFLGIAVFAGNGDALRPAAATVSAGGIATAAGLVVFAFLGFETVGAAAEEARDPARAVVPAILGTVILCGLLFVALAVALLALAPPAALATAEPLSAALRAHGLPGPAALLNVAAALATLGVLLVYLLASTRIFLALAREGQLPRGLATLHPRHATPNRMTLLVGGVTAVSAALLPLDFLVTLTNESNLFFFALVCLAVPLLRRAAPREPRPFHVPGGDIIPIVAALACVALMGTFAFVVHLGYLAWLGLGVMIYAMVTPTASAG
jgi:APA family basic amino acid/polyamine antiporter